MSNLYIAGETGDPNARALCAQIALCEKSWAGDRAYRDVLYKLDEVSQALDLLTASPGHRAAMRAPEVSSSGQEPKNRQEAPSQVQR